MIVVDSTDETSIGLTTALPRTVTVSSVAASRAVAKSTLVAVPTLTDTLRASPPLRLTWYWPVGNCAKR